MSRARCGAGNWAGRGGDQWVESPGGGGGVVRRVCGGGEAAEEGSEWEGGSEDGSFVAPKMTG